jgi:hypothetical protein
MKRILTLIALAATALAVGGSPTQAGLIGSRPDGMIRKANVAPFRGDDIYDSSGADQRVSQRVLAGQSTMFVWRIQNDGFTGGAFTVCPTGGSSHYRVRYFIGGVEVTEELLTCADRYFDKDAVIDVVVKVKVKRSAPVGSSHDFPLFVAKPTSTDTVHAVVKRK